MEVGGEVRVSSLKVKNPVLHDLTDDEDDDDAAAAIIYIYITLASGSNNNRPGSSTMHLDGTCTGSFERERRQLLVVN